MTCLASRLGVVAIAAYLVASLAHDAVFTWVVVLVAVTVVFLWSRTPNRRTTGQCNSSNLWCTKQASTSTRQADPARDEPGDIDGDGAVGDGAVGDGAVDAFAQRDLLLGAWSSAVGMPEGLDDPTEQ